MIGFKKQARARHVDGATSGRSRPIPDGRRGVLSGQLTSGSEKFDNS